MKKYFKIVIKTSFADEVEILIAELSDNNFYAFEQEENTLAAYIKEEDFDEEELKKFLPVNTSFTKKIIEDENWNKQWENGIQPVIVHDFAAIRPSFCEPIKNVKHDLIITPKMSFGTGHHATTFLMIEMMEKIDFRDKTVIDFGTGTGVLAILAEKCGAAKITAIDYDEWSINNTHENIFANDCKNISIEKQNDLSDLKPVDIILANINLDVLARAASSISILLKTRSFFLASGFLLEGEKELQNIFELKSVLKKESHQRDGWMAILFQKM
ncbi:MAG TPA: 50S ribosomal protein L11 methyltransferase [Hanamia sp.]